LLEVTKGKRPIAWSDVTDQFMKSIIESDNVFYGPAQTKATIEKVSTMATHNLVKTLELVTIDSFYCFLGPANLDRS